MYHINLVVSVLGSLYLWYTMLKKQRIDKMSETREQRKERERKEDIQRLRGFRPIDDDFMRCIFRDDIPLAQHVLRIITQKKDLKILSLETQADMKRLVGARSICLDAYGTDSTGKKYDLEIQRADKGAGAHRARYHSSVMEIENLNARQDFDELPDTYTIFITENDIFEKGLSFYPVERINLATGELFGDGEHILYVNGAYEGNDDIGKLMHDFRCSDPNDMLDERMAAKTRYFKETEEGVEYMCKAMEDMRNATAKEKACEIAINLLNIGKMVYEEIAQVTGLDIKDVEQLAKSK